MMIVRVAVWLVPPEALVEAVTLAVVVPTGVPGFFELVLLHEVSPDASDRNTNTLKICKPRSARFLRPAMPRTIARPGNRSA